MTSKNTETQETLFQYGAPFTMAMDHTFLRSLVIQKNRDGWTTDEIPDDALQVARLSVNYYHNVVVSYEDVVARSKMMELRFQTFKKVSNFKGADYINAHNNVIATDRIWNKMIKKMPFAQAYRYAGDPEFHNLCILFGALSIKKERTASIINVSSTNKTTVILSDDEEVDSPAPKSGVRKKLFAEDVAIDDQLSTCNNEPAHEFVAPDGERLFPPRNAFPPPYFGNSGCTSSCALSSPGKFDWGPFGGDVP